MPALAYSTLVPDRHTKTRNAVSSAEFALLLACCSLRKEEFREPPGPNNHFDWAKVLELAEHHGVTPLVYRALTAHTGFAPAEVVEQLRKRYEHTARTNLRFAAELFRILDCLEAHAIPAIPLKGPVLAETVYGDLALRDFSDLDVLVNPLDVMRAKAALQTLDYSLATSLSDAEERAYLAAGYEYTFDGPAGRNLLELQWNILPRFYAVAFDVDELFARSASAPLCGRTVRALSPEDLFLALATHAAKHAWIRLHWLRDIAGVIETHRLDWTTVIRRARELGIARITGVSLVLAQRLLHANLPEEAQTLCMEDEEILPLVESIEQELPVAEGYNVESTRYFRLMMRLRERRMDHARFLWRLATTPGAGEWAVIRLPEFLFPLYRVIRIFRLSARPFHQQRR
jgi:hypothetical protein